MASHNIDFLKWNKYDVRQSRNIIHLTNLNKNTNETVIPKNITFTNVEISDEKEKTILSIKEKYDELIIKKQNFDWIQYIKENPDLVNILDKYQAWHHWVTNGQYEGRNITLIQQKYSVNDTTVHHGRFGNLFFVNMVLHFIATKYDLKMKYKYHPSFIKLGIHLYSGSKTYENNTYLTEFNYMDLMNQTTNFTNIIVNNHTWFHNYELSLLLRIHFNNPLIKTNIIKKNIYKDRYKNNNDIFLHIRMGDVEKMGMNNNFEYFQNILSKYPHNEGYIASDDINSELCIQLIKEYNLIPILYKEEETIMFGSTCNTIILSGGTFSWMIGFFAYYSKNIVYPINKNRWYGNIFVYEDWIGEIIT
jgi:hypothetical protein